TKLSRQDRRLLLPGADTLVFGREGLGHFHFPAPGLGLVSRHAVRSAPQTGSVEETTFRRSLLHGVPYDGIRIRSGGESGRRSLEDAGLGRAGHWLRAMSRTWKQARGGSACQACRPAARPHDDRARPQRPVVRTEDANVWPVSRANEGNRSPGGPVPGQTDAVGECRRPRLSPRRFQFAVACTLLELRGQPYVGRKRDVLAQ